MAASSKDEAVGHWQKVDHLIECSICIDKLKKPKALPCIHTFCLDCLENYGKAETVGSTMPCPLCRKIFTIPRGGFENLPNNFLIDELISNRDALETQPGGLMCEMCGDEQRKVGLIRPTVTKFCVNCFQYACDGCASSHAKVRATHSHKLVSVEDRRMNQDLVGHSNYCTEHDNEIVKLYCYDCEKPICSKCKTVNHNEHVCADLKQSVDNFLEEMQQLFPDIEDTISSMELDVCNQDREKENLLKETSAVEELIRNRCFSVIRLVERERDHLVDKLNTFKSRRLKEIERRTDEIQGQSVIVESFKICLEKLLKQRSTYKISLSAVELLDKAKNLLIAYKQFDAEMQNKEKISFIDSNTKHNVNLEKESDKLIGDIVISKDTGYHTTLRGGRNRADVLHVMPYSGKTVAGLATLGGQLFIVHADSSQVEIYSTPSFTAAGQLTLPKMLNACSLVACSHHNCLYVSDNSDGGYIHRVRLADGSVTRWAVGDELAGLSVTRAHNLLVTRLKAKMVNEYTTQGELVREIRLDESIQLPWHSMELSTGQLVVCHTGSPMHRVCLVDTQGCVLRSYSGTNEFDWGQLGSPYCLAVDASDYVFVSDFYHKKVHVLSPSLEFFEEIGLSSHDMIRPYRLHLDQLNSRLYISEDDGRVFVVSTAFQKTKFLSYPHVQSSLKPM